METQILNEILTNLKTLNSSVNELKEGQSRLEQRFDVDVGSLKQDVKVLNAKVDKLDGRVFNLEKIVLGLRDDIDTVYVVSSRTQKFIKKHFSEQDLNSIVVDF